MCILHPDTYAEHTSHPQRIWPVVEDQAALAEHGKCALAKPLTPPPFLAMIQASSILHLLAILILLADTDRQLHTQASINAWRCSSLARRRKWKPCACHCIIKGHLSRFPSHLTNAVLHTQFQGRQCPNHPILSLKRISCSLYYCSALTLVGNASRMCMDTQGDGSQCLLIPMQHQ